MNIKIFILLFLPCLTFAQVPKKINFQAVLRNNDGEILSNKQVSVKIGILSGNPNGSSIYSENHVKSTDIMGLLSLKIGEGTPLTGLFSQINWGNAPHFIKLEADFNGGNNYQDIGTQELMSVPYAFYSDNGLPQAGNTLGNMLYWNGTKWENISSGQNGQMLQLVNGVPTWTGLAFGLVTTSAPTAITPGSAIVGGNVTNDGGSTITARGIVYGITPNPTLNNSKINFGVGTGSFSGPLNIGLKENTTYYYRAFATNSVGTIYGNQEAMKALMNIEGFRNLNQDIETIINKSEAVKKAKKEANDREMSKKEKQELTDDEKEFKSLRKQIQEKLIKFTTRIPVFMYLTDYRERSLKAVITQLEPGLFKKVTGLSVKDFELLVSLGLFNPAHMNQAVFGFKRYEDASLEYIGINKHAGQSIGLYDTVLSRKEYEENFVNEP